MALLLNTPNEYIKIDGHKIPYLREFAGQNVQEAPKVDSSGRVYMSIANLMQRRLDVRNAPEDVRSAWMDNYFNTFDLKGQRGNEFKIALTTYADGSLTQIGKEYLALINPNEKLVNGAVNLGVEDRYDRLQGKGVIVVNGRDKLASVVDEWQSQQQAKDSLFWRITLRNPDDVPDAFAIPDLHNEAIPYIFAAYKEKFAKDTSIGDIRAMGVFPDSVSDDIAELRAWFVGGLEYGSVANGRSDLGSSRGRFAGFAPEALNALKRDIDFVRQ